MTTESESVMIEWSDYSGQVYHGAAGHRDVLLIASEDNLSHPDAVQRRPAIELTSEVKEDLQLQGIIMDDKWSDLALLKARYNLDKEHKVLGIEMSQPNGNKVTKKNVLKSICDLMSKCTEGGVVLYYTGCGRKNTGDWCFTDGFITFRDLIRLYLQLLRGRVMTIVTDCSNSGCWVKECLLFLDKERVGPCGHCARNKGILVKVIASCLSHEVPQQLTHSIHGCKNSTEGFLMFLIQERVTLKANMTSAQHTIALDATRLRCGQKSIQNECLCSPQDSWQAWSVAQRVYTLIGVQEGRRMWHILLVADNHMLALELMEKTQDRNRGKFTVDQNIYGEVLKSGWGKRPSKGELQRVKYEFIESAKSKQQPLQHETKVSPLPQEQEPAKD